jgi:hypothetical protein
MMEEDKMESHQKGFFKVKCFSPLLYLKRLLELFFLFLYFFFALSLKGLGVLMIFDEKITSSKTSFQMASKYWRWTHIPECSYACQHG